MKKLTAVLIAALIVILSTACVLLPSSALLLGDVDGDGKVTSTDARLTLQLSVTYPTVIYPNLPICQVYFLTPVGRVTKLYRGKYAGATGSMASRWNRVDAADS